MPDITQDIHSVTTCRRRPGEFLKQLRRNKRPLILTVKGKPAAVVQDEVAYQRLLDVAAQAEAEEGIRQGREDLKQRRLNSARTFFDDFEARHGISG